MFLFSVNGMNKEILRLAIPNIISNISTPLLSSVDIFLMGNLSARHLGAVGIGGMLFNIIYWNFGFLRMGTTGITAQAYGAEDRGGIIHTLLRAVFLALFLALIILLIQKPLSDVSFWLLNVLPDQKEMVYSYFIIRLWAAPATLSIYVLNGWLFGMQNAWWPLVATVIVNIANIVLSYFLVYQYGWGIEGVAWGTVVAQYIGFFLLLAIILLKYRSHFDDLSLKALKALEPIKHFMNINKDIFIRTIFLTFAFGFFYSQSSKMGAMILAGNLILLQFLNWMSYGIDGFAFAAESLVGKYKGRNDQPGLHRIINRLLIWGLVLALVYTTVFVVFGRFLSGIFSDDLAVIEISEQFLFWMYLMPVLAFLSYMWDGIYIGLTASKAMVSTMFQSLIIYLAVYFILKIYIVENHALWLALGLFLLSRGILQQFLFRKKGMALK